MKHSVLLVFMLLLTAASVGVLFVSCGQDNPLVENINVTGILYLPSEAAGRAFIISVDDNTDFEDGFIKSLCGTCGSEIETDYSLSDVPAGTYYVYAMVCMVGDCDGDPQVGDYLGFYGTGLPPPREPNAVIPDTGTVTLDITLSELMSDDWVPPSTPIGLECSVINEAEIDLNWHASSDDVGIAGYLVYLGGDSLQTVPDTFAMCDGLDCETLHCFQVSAIDTAGNESAWSTQTCCTTDHCPDTVPPSTPTGLVCNAIDETRIDLSWQASTDNVEIAGYIVYRDDDSLITVLDTTLTDGGLNCDTSYCYQVSAVDAAGNQSLLSNQACCAFDSCPDTEPPGVPIVVCTVSGDNISVYWTDPSDNVGVVGYRLYRNGWFSWQDVSWCCATDVGVNCGSVYEYEVVAYDAAGNRSAPGETSCHTDECDW